MSGSSVSTTPPLKQGAIRCEARATGTTARRQVGNSPGVVPRLSRVVEGKQWRSQTQRFI